MSKAKQNLSKRYASATDPGKARSFLERMSPERAEKLRAKKNGKREAVATDESYTP